MKECRIQMMKINNEVEKERKIQLIEEFYQINGRLPKYTEKSGGIAIGRFLSNIKQKNTKIAEEQMSRLEILGFNKNETDKEEEKERKIQLIEEFYQINGRLPKQNEVYKGIAIGQFLNSIRQGNTKITEEQMNRLMKLGFEGQINDIKLDYSVIKMGQFYRKYKRLPDQGESIGNEKNKVGDILLLIRIGKIRITEGQFTRLQQMNANLLREQVQFLEKQKKNKKK